MSIDQTGLNFNFNYLNNTETMSRFEKNIWDFSFFEPLLYNNSQFFPNFNMNLGFDFASLTAQFFNWNGPSNYTSLIDTNVIKTVDNAIKKDLSNYPKKIVSSKNVNNTYSKLSKSEAYKKALKDKNLEKLSNGKNWEISEASFITDIPFAKKGTGVILDKVANMLGHKLTITSALGTGEGNSPHQKSGYVSHHNAENPKLDIRIVGNREEFVRKLKSTGYFSHVYVDKNHKTHVDVQIDPAKFEQLEYLA